MNIGKEIDTRTITPARTTTPKEQPTRRRIPATKPQTAPSQPTKVPSKK